MEKERPLAPACVIPTPCQGLRACDQAPRAENHLTTDGELPHHIQPSSDIHSRHAATLGGIARQARGLRPSRRGPGRLTHRAVRDDGKIRCRTPETAHRGARHAAATAVAEQNPETRVHGFISLRAYLAARGYGRFVFVWERPGNGRRVRSNRRAGARPGRRHASSGASHEEVTIAKPCQLDSPQTREFKLAGSRRPRAGEFDLSQGAAGLGGSS